MYRFPNFAREFFKFLFKFDSYSSIISKIVLAVGGLAIFAFLKTPVWLTIWTSPPWFYLKWTIGEYLLAISILLYICIGVGVAIARSTKYKMEVAHKLKIDKKWEMIRLLVRNKGTAPIRPVARLCWVNTIDIELDTTRLPIDFEWKDDKNNATYTNASIEIDVVGFSGESLIFAPAPYNPKVPRLEIPNKDTTGNNITIFFGIIVSLPIANISIKRAFCLKPNNNYPLGYETINMKPREARQYFRKSKCL